MRPLLNKEDDIELALPKGQSRRESLGVGSPHTRRIHLPAEEGRESEER